MSDTNKMKAYITTIKYRNVQKQLWFMGEDTQEGELLFKQACVEHDKVGEQSQNWDEFFTKSVEHFKSFGFIRIQK